MTEEQKREIENRLNRMEGHSYNVALEYEYNAINFVLNTLGYYIDWEFCEYKIKKCSH